MGWVGGKGTQSYSGAQTQQKQNNNQQSCGEGLKMYVRGRGEGAKLRGKERNVGLEQEGKA